MKKIVLHSAATDNAGNFHDAGAELDVGGADKAGVITLERARDLIDRARAVSATASAELERASTPEGGSKA